MADTELLVKIGADISGLQKGLNEVKSSVGNLSQGLSDMAAKFISFVALEEFVRRSLKAAQEHESAVKSLTVALENNGMASKQVVKNYVDMADKLQMITGFEDDEIIKMQTRLTIYTKGTQITEGMTRAILDYAKVQKVDAATAAEQLGRAIENNTGRMGRLNLGFKDGMSIQEKLSQATKTLTGLFGGQAEALTTGGERMNLALKDLEKTVGMQLLGTMEEFQTSIAITVTSITSWIKETSFLKESLIGLKVVLITATEGIVGFAKSIYGTLTKNQSMMQEGYKNIHDAATGAMVKYNGMLEEGRQKDLTKNEEYHNNKLAAQQRADDAIKNQVLANAAELKNLKDMSNGVTLTDDQVHKLAVEQADTQFFAEKNKKQIDAEATYLNNQRKFGTAYALLEKTINNESLKGTASAAAAMVEMQNSKNQTLRSIGKAAAVADITYNTAQSAMAVFRGFASIPIVGFALGIAAAGAVIAYGMEKISLINKAQQGGIVPGVGSGDKVPMLLEPGELIVPKQIAPNFIDAVKDGGGGTSSGSSANIILSLKDDLMNFVEMKLIERKNLNISLQRA